MIGGVGVGVGAGGGDEMTTGVVMTREYVAEADVPAAAVTVTLKVPDAPGVPLIVPPADIVSPAGSPLAAHVMVPVPPVAVTVVL
jgi:hypothetical protein